jgi:hypothetical protein
MLIYYLSLPALLQCKYLGLKSTFVLFTAGTYTIKNTCRSKGIGREAGRGT